MTVRLEAIEEKSGNHHTSRLRQKIASPISLASRNLASSSFVSAAVLAVFQEQQSRIRSKKSSQQTLSRQPQFHPKLIPRRSNITSNLFWIASLLHLLFVLTLTRLQKSHLYQQLEKQRKTQKIECRLEMLAIHRPKVLWVSSLNKLHWELRGPL